MELIGQSLRAHRNLKFTGNIQNTRKSNHCVYRANTVILRTTSVIFRANQVIFRTNPVTIGRNSVIFREIPVIFGTNQVILGTN